MICGLTPPPCWPIFVEVLGAYAMRMVAVHILMKWLIEKKKKSQCKTNSVNTLQVLHYKSPFNNFCVQNLRCWLLAVTACDIPLSHLQV